MNVLIVGSGPTGATYARLLLEGAPDAHVAMVDAGPQLTKVPGENVRNIPDEQDRTQARLRSQGPASGSDAGFASPVVVEGTLTARQGTFLIAHGGPGSGEADGMPAAAVSRCVGGQGAHWTCATPRPHGSERITEIPDPEWEDAIAEAERLLHTTTSAFADSSVSIGIRKALGRVFNPRLPDDRPVRILPVAGDVAADGSVRWAGTDTVLGPLVDAASDLSSRFDLRPETICRRLLLVHDRVVGAEVEHLPSATVLKITADVVVVAADAIHTPQLLWASGIRPPALGHHLTEHPGVFGIIALNEDVTGSVPTPPGRGSAAPSDPIAGVTNVPFVDDVHPFHAQIMFLHSPPFQIPEDHPLHANPWGYAMLGWGTRKWPRWEDHIAFSDDEADSYGMPRVHVHYALTEAEEAELQQARVELDRAAAALGRFVPGGEPRRLPSGGSLHYSGTVRIGAADDGTSVCDTYSRVWGVEGLVLGGNGLIPTANACNPTLTSVALAVRGARHLLDRHG